MKSNNKCRYKSFCKNNTCEECDKQSKFQPIDEIRHLFRKGHTGPNESSMYLNTTHNDLKPTHTIKIDNSPFCPYCGNKSFYIQNPETLVVTGYCCFCDGARAELKYEAEKAQLKLEYEEKLNNLNNKYSKKLKFCSHKLFATYQKLQKRRFQFFNNSYNHISTINGEIIRNIDEIIM